MYKIIIIDENVINRKVLERMFFNDYDIAEAGSGSEALRILRNDPTSFSAILIDIVKPFTDGFSFLEKYKNDSNINNIPVIVTTDSKGEKTEIKAFTLGASDFIYKPYNQEIIKHRVANLIRLSKSSVKIDTPNVDTLTGLYSKKIFFEKAKNIINQNKDKAYVFISINIDRFQLFNDICGRQAGDKLLINIAQRLKKIASQYNILSSRILSDQFSVLCLNDTNKINSVIHNISDVKSDINETMVISYSFGVFEVDNLNMSISDMCDRAKLAGERFNGKYGNEISYYNDSMRSILVQEQQIINEMKNALINKQYKIYYQAKFDLSTSELVGAEALVRWQHPQKGIIPPSEFIPVFEKNGFISELDVFVWSSVVKNLSRWTDLNFPQIPISVNMSRVDIDSMDVVDVIKGLLNKYDVNPKLFHVEITETTFADGYAKLNEVVCGLKDLGCIIEMDDFGSGYSSLNMLDEVYADVLKIDMRFLKNQSNGRNNDSILNFIIKLAKNLGMDIIAEGVETKEDLEKLVSMKCKYGQGYLYSKPLSREKFEKLLINKQIKCNNYVG